MATDANIKLDMKPSGKRPKTAAQERLMDLGNRAFSLADRLNAAGDPLTEEDRMLMSMASLPALRELFQQAQMEYLSGVPKPQILDNLALNFHNL
jgi:hypothetical protein